MSKAVYMTKTTNGERRQKLRSRINWNKIAFIFVGLFPLFSHLILFWGLTQVKGLATAFIDQNTGGFTLGYFRYAIKAFSMNAGTDLGVAFKNTMLYFVVSLITLPLCIFISYMFYKKMPGATVCRVLFLIPNAVGSFMLAMLFQQAFMDNSFLMKFFNETLHLKLPSNIMIEHATPMMIVFVIWTSIGGGLPIWLGTLSRIPKDLLEYAELDGVGPFREFVSIIMPLIWPTYVTYMTLAFIGMLGASGPLLFFTEGRYGTWTLSYYIFNSIYTGSTSLQPVSIALGLLMSLFSVPIVVIGRLILNRFGGEVQY